MEEKKGVKRFADLDSDKKNKTEEKKKMFRLLNFSLERDDKIRDEADFEYKNGVYAIVGNIIYVSERPNLWLPNEIYFRQKTDEEVYEYIRITVYGKQINEVKKVKTNCSNDEKELFEFMKNRVNEKMESLDKFDEMLNNDDLYEEE